MPSRARPTSTAPHLLPDGKSQAFVLAIDATGTVCDANAPAKSCARSITQFAGMAQQYQRKADLVIRRGAVVTVNEIFTP